MNDTTTETKSNRAVVYLRTGSGNQLDSRLGLDTQQRICEDYARHLGVRITRIYADAGISGRATQRPALDQMMGDLSLCWTPYVITADPARLARNQTLSLALELQLGRFGTQLITASTADGSYMEKQVTRKEDEDVTKSS